jgi:hypothetical protein
MLEFKDFTEWAQAAHDRGLWLFGTPTGSEARFPATEVYDTLWGFWEYGKKYGWLKDVLQSDQHA